MPGFVPDRQDSFTDSKFGSMAMYNSSRAPGFSFRKRWERVDWKKLACVDVDRIARELDFQSLQENIMNVTFCNIENELDPHYENANFVKLFKLAQFCIEYLLHSQEYLTSNLETLEEKLQQTVKALEESNQETKKKKEAYNHQKKEIRKLKKWIAEYQIMMRAGASGLHKCIMCSKTFVSNEYLTAHLQRRHHGDLRNGIAPGGYQSVGPSSEENKLLMGDVQDIKERLKATESQLETERRERQKERASDKRTDIERADYIHKQYESWKRDEESRHMEEMADFKRSFLQELREMQEKNAELEKTVYELRKTPIVIKKSMVGDLQDEDELDNARSRQDIEQTREMLQAELKSMQKAKQDLEKLDQKMRRKEQKLQQDHDMEIAKLREMLDQYSSALGKEQKDKQQITVEYEKRMKDVMEKFNQHDRMLADQKAQVTNLEKSNVPRPAERAAPPAITISKTPMKSSLKSPNSTLKDEDSEAVTFYVSNNGNQNYRVWKTLSTESREWTDVFSFNAYTSETGDFDMPLYVFSAGGSPYWRQYISDDSHQPASGYHLDYVIYVSPDQVPGSQQYFVLNGGSGPVIKSCISKMPALQGWKEGTISFYAYKTTGLQKSVTLKSTETFTEEDSDTEEFSGSATAESLDTAGQDKVDAAPQETLTETGTMGMSSEWGTTTLETGTFIPFQRNPTITTRYNHKQDVVLGCRQEIEEVLEQSLAKRGLPAGTKRLSTKQLEAKMELLANERNAMAKKRKNFFEIRQRKAEEVDELAKEKYMKQKGSKPGAASTSGAKPPSMKAAGTAARAASALSSGKGTKQSLASSGGSVSLGSQSITATSVTDRTVSISEDDDDESLEESETPELVQPAQRQSNFSLRTPEKNVPKPRSPMGYDDDDDDFDSDLDDDDIEDLTRVTQKTPSTAPRGEKVRSLAASLESSLGSRGGIKKPAGSVDIMTSSPQKQSQAAAKIPKLDDDSDFDISSDDAETEPRAGPKLDGTGQGARPTPAPRRTTPSPPRTLTNTAVTRFDDEFSDFDDDDLDIENIT